MKLNTEGLKGFLAFFFSFFKSVLEPSCEARSHAQLLSVEC